MRRLLALVSGLAMLHLTLVGQLPCAPDGSAATTKAHSMDAMDMGDMAMGGSHADSHHAPSNQQTPQKCCEAMSGCGISVSIAAATRVAAAMSPNSDAPVMEQVALLSFQTAPEPPPPKA